MAGSATERDDVARGIVLGLGVALAKQSRNTLLRNAAGCYIWLFRSLPLLVLLIFIFNLPQIFPDNQRVTVESIRSRFAGADS